MVISITIVAAILIYLLMDKAIVDNKIVRRYLVSFLIILSIVFTSYTDNKPIVYTDTLYFSRNLLDKVANSEEDYLEYGEYKIMKSLESLFMQSWLPNVKTTDTAEYIEPNFKVKGKIINSAQLKDIFKDNKFLNKINYYRLVLPDNMQISRNIDKEVSGKAVRISFNNIWAAVTIKLSYLEPHQMIYVEMCYEENGLIVYFSRKRRNYEKWYFYLRDQLRNIHYWDKKEEALLTVLGDKT